MSEKLQLSFVPCGLAAKVDREKNVLYGAQVAMLGEAKGHNMEMDDTTLNQIVELGNESGRGVRVRFGHPTECTPALGSVIGYRKNFRRDGQYVKADLHFLEPEPDDVTMKGNIAHVIALAEQAPDKIGNSVEIMVDLERREKDEDGNVPLPLVRVKSLHAVDVVEEPASGDGMFATPVEGVNLSPRTIVELRDAAKKPGFIDRVLSFALNRKTFAEQIEPAEGDVPEAQNQEVLDMSMTLDQLREKHPEAFVEFSTELREDPGFLQSGIDAERLRVNAILDLCKPCHFIPSEKYPQGFGAHAIKSGMDAGEQTKEMLAMYESMAKGRKLDVLTEASASIDADSAPPVEPQKLNAIELNGITYLDKVRAKYAGKGN